MNKTCESHNNQLTLIRSNFTNLSFHTEIKIHTN